MMGMDMKPPALTDQPIASVTSVVTSLGEPAYRADQVLRWVYRRLAASFDEMTDLPQGLRRKLTAGFRLHTTETARELVSKDGTVKTLFRLHDGKTVEAALMLYAAGAGRPRTTVCVSTQVGCAIGCRFCATGRQGFERNLTPGEMIDQVLYFARRVNDQGEGTETRSGHVTNVVFMGMGEPLANYGSLLQAIETLTSPKGFGSSPRGITVSTAGMVPQITQLAVDQPQVGLAVSLHAADNALRNDLVPLNRRYPLEELILACREYVRQTGRRITFEYILLAGVNDSLEQVRALARLVEGLNCHVNLIPANRMSGEFQPPSRRVTLAFEQALREAGVNCTVRVSRGQDIDAGCGQLRSKCAPQHA
jgi:23S rRNA (adenine2503-C2)-methyltransferase